MDLADLRRGKRIGIAVTEVIVVRANNDVFGGFAWKIGEDVAYGGADGIDVHVESYGHAFGKGEGFGLAACVDLALHAGERFARGGEPVLRYVVLYLHQKDAGVFRSAHATEARQQILLAVAEFAVNDDHGAGAMVTRVDRLGNEGRMAGEPLISTFRGEAARLVSKPDDDLPPHVEAGVIVVAEFVGGGAVAGEDEPACNFT